MRFYLLQPLGADLGHSRSEWNSDEAMVWQIGARLTWTPRVEHDVTAGLQSLGHTFGGLAEQQDEMPTATLRITLEGGGHLRVRALVLAEPVGGDYFERELIARSRDLTQAIRLLLEDLDRGEMLPQSAIIAIERLIGAVYTQLDQRESELRQRLERAELEIDYLRRHIALLRDAVAQNRKSFIKPLLAGVAAILLAVTTGAAEGIASHVVSPSDKRQVTVEQLLRDCRAIEEGLESD